MSVVIVAAFIIFSVIYVILKYKKMDGEDEL